MRAMERRVRTETGREFFWHGGEFLPKVPQRCIEDAQMARRKKPSPGPKHKGGPPPFPWTEDIEIEIFSRLAGGESMKSICRTPGMPSPETVYARCFSEPEFDKRYLRAREMQAEYHADEIIEIADDGSNDWMARNDPNNPGWVANGENINRSRLRIDARKWIAVKLLPRKFGDKAQVEVRQEFSLEELINEANKLRAQEAVGNNSKIIEGEKIPALGYRKS
jgi:hypothetical protein